MKRMGIYGMAFQGEIREDGPGAGAWLVHIPTALTPWEHWTVTTVSMAQFEGFPEAKKDYPGAEYEILVMAVDSKLVDHTRPETWRRMHPTNYRKQFHGVDRPGAEQVNAYIVDQIINGYLPPEPQGLYGARMLFDEHMRNAISEVTAGRELVDLKNR